MQSTMVHGIGSSFDAGAAALSCARRQAVARLLLLWLHPALRSDDGVAAGKFAAYFASGSRLIG